MIECATYELRSLFPFELLSEEQLDRLSCGGTVTESSPGDTRFISLLPLEAGAAGNTDEA